MTLQEKLVAVQQELKAPKSKYNSFGKYNYRSCEDILEGVKPLLKKQGILLTLEDTIIEVGGRLFVKATATITDCNDSTSITTSAYAGHEVEKKGMDFSQITGTASSYARKYALNGLFLIDDTKDADTDEYQKQTATPVTKQKIQEGAIYARIEMAKTLDDLKRIPVDFGFQVADYPTIKDALNARAKEIKTN